MNHGYKTVEWLHLLKPGGCLPGSYVDSKRQIVLIVRPIQVESERRYENKSR